MPVTLAFPFSRSSSPPRPSRRPRAELLKTTRTVEDAKGGNSSKRREKGASIESPCCSSHLKLTGVISLPAGGFNRKHSLCVFCLRIPRLYLLPSRSVRHDLLLQLRAEAFEVLHYGLFRAWKKRKGLPTAVRKGPLMSESHCRSRKPQTCPYGDGNAATCVSA